MYNATLLHERGGIMLALSPTALLFLNMKAKCYQWLMQRHRMNANTQSLKTPDFKFVPLLKPKNLTLDNVSSIKRKVSYLLARIYCVRSTALLSSHEQWSFFIFHSNNVDFSTGVPPSCPEAFRSPQTLIFSISVQGFSFSEVFCLIYVYKWALIF